MAYFGIFKRGNQKNNSNLNIGMKEGMLVYVHDEAIHGSIELLSAWMKTVFVAMKINDSYIARMRLWTQLDATYDIPNMITNLNRSRRYKIDLQKLAQDLGDTSLYERWGKTEVVEPVDYVGQTDLSNIEQDSRLTDYSKVADVLDRNAITSGTFSVGTGKTYSLFSAFFADFGTMTGDLIGELQTDITETSGTVMTHDTDGFDFYMTSDTPHDGVYGAGWTVTAGINTHLYDAGGITNAGEFYCQDMSSIRTTAGFDGFRSFVAPKNTNGFHFHDLFIDGNGLRGGGVVAYDSIGTMYNIGIWDCLDTGVGVLAVHLGGGADGAVFEAIFTENCSIGIRDHNSTAASYRNIGCYNSGTVDWQNSFASATGNDLVATDTSAWGTNAQDSLTLVDEVVSDDETNANYMVPVSGNISASNSAMTIAANIVDLRGVTWDATNPSIGPFQFVAAPSGGLLERSYPRGNERGILRGVI